MIPASDLTAEKDAACRAWGAATDELESIRRYGTPEMIATAKAKEQAAWDWVKRLIPEACAR